MQQLRYIDQQESHCTMQQLHKARHHGSQLSSTTAELIANEFVVQRCKRFVPRVTQRVRSRRRLESSSELVQLAEYGRTTRDARGRQASAPDLEEQVAEATSETEVDERVEE